MSENTITASIDNILEKLSKQGEILNRASSLVEEIKRAADGWQTIDTAPLGQQVIIWEPMYGWLLCYKDIDNGWMLKSSGNFYCDLPGTVELTHWHALPDRPGASATAHYRPLSEQGASV